MILLETDFYSLLDKVISVLRYSFAKKFQSALDEISYFLKEDSANRMKILVQMIIIWLNDIQRLRIGNHDSFFNQYSENLKKFNLRFPLIKLNDTVVRIDYFGSNIPNNINLNLIAVNIIFELSALVDNKMRY